MKKDDYVVILVHSTSYALRVENVLKKSNISCKLIPIPRQLSSDCGVCIRIDCDDKQAALKALALSHIKIDGIHNI